MALPEVVTTRRLLLPLWDAGTARAIRAGERLPRWHGSFPREDDVDAASLWREGDPWGPRSVVLQGWTVGSVGFYGPPDSAPDGVPEVEVGYALVPEGRGRGIVPEALAALLELTDAAGVRVRASIAPDNAASLRVAAKVGLTRLRGASEDGELVMVRPLP